MTIFKEHKNLLATEHLYRAINNYLDQRRL
jgi:hypothetical protein